MKVTKMRTAKFFLLLVVVLALCACGADGDSSAVTIVTSEEEIASMLNETIENKENDFSKFSNVDPEVLNKLLLENMRNAIPTEIVIDSFTDFHWEQSLDYCEIAEASMMSEEQKNVFRNYRKLVEEAIVHYDELKEVYVSYAGYVRPDEAYDKFEYGRTEMRSIKEDYDNALYYKFYVRNALKNNIGREIADVISGDGDVNYYYANDVVDTGLMGEWWGDEHYCIAIKGTFPESGVYTLLAYQPDYVELSDANGFVVNATVCVVVTEEERAAFETLYSGCKEKEDLIANTLKQAKSVMDETQSEPVENKENISAVDNIPQKVTTGYEDNFTGQYKAEFESVEIRITAASSSEHYLTYTASGVTLSDIPAAYTTMDGNGLMFFIDEYYPEYAGYVEVIYDDVMGYSYNAELNGLEGTGGTYSPLE